MAPTSGSSAERLRVMAWERRCRRVINREDSSVGSSARRAVAVGAGGLLVRGHRRALVRILLATLAPPAHEAAVDGVGRRRRGADEVAAAHAAVDGVVGADEDAAAEDAVAVGAGDEGDELPVGVDDLGEEQGGAVAALAEHAAQRAAEVAVAAVDAAAEDADLVAGDAAQHLPLPAQEAFVAHV